MGSISTHRARLFVSALPPLNSFHHSNSNAPHKRTPLPNDATGPLAEKLGGAMRAGGRVIVYGLMGGMSFTGNALACLFNQVTYGGFWLEPWLASMSAEGQADVMKRTMAALEGGVMKPEVGKVYDLADYKAAVEESLKVARGGKVLLKLN